MKSINTLVSDRYTEHSVNLMRIEESNAELTVKYLTRLRKDVINQLKLIDPTEPGAETWKQKRLEKFLEQINKTIKTAYSEFRNELKTELVNLGQLEAGLNVSTINSLLQTEVLTVGLTREAVRTIVNKSLIQGTLISDWMSRLAGNTKFKIQDQMRMGLLAGENLQDLVVRLRGRAIPGKPGQYTGGVFTTSTREAEAVARTATHTVSSLIREDVLKDNQDVLKGMEALVTLDLRTSDICISRSKMAWDFDGNPLPGTNTTIRYPGPTPWHWKCRTNLIPVIKELDELGARVKGKIPKSTQASMDGQISEDIDYEDWLSSKPVGTQRDILGPTKYKLWKDGKIDNFRDLIDQKGRPLTVAELNAKYGRVEYL